jgi:hypothetical protein
MLEGFAASEAFLKKARPQFRRSGMFLLLAHPVFIEIQLIPKFPSLRQKKIPPGRRKNM